MKKSLGSNLTNEDGNLLGLPSDFYYDVLKIEFDGRGKSSDDERSDDGAHYIYEKMGNMILVEMNSGIKAKKTKSKSGIKAKKTKSKDVTLLDSLLKLRTELSDSIFSKPMMLLDNDSTLLTEKVIDKIIKWCSRNGYPFEIPYKEFEKNYKESEKPRKYELFKKILRDQKRFGFKVGDFLISLNNLYCCYKMYSVLTNEIDSIEEHLFLIDDKEPFDSTEQHDKTADKCKRLFNMEFDKTALPYIDLYGKKVDKCTELLNRQIKKIAWDKYVSIENEFVTQSLFDAALYQLAQIMQCKGKDVHICECCGDLFVRTNKNKKYCGGRKCYPQKQYGRKKLAEKRQLKNSEKTKTI